MLKISKVKRFSFFYIYNKELWASENYHITKKPHGFFLHTCALPLPLCLPHCFYWYDHHSTLQVPLTLFGFSTLFIIHVWYLVCLEDLQRWWWWKAEFARGEARHGQGFVPTLVVVTVSARDGNGLHMELAMHSSRVLHVSATSIAEARKAFSQSSSSVTVLQILVPIWQTISFSLDFH